MSNDLDFYDYYLLALGRLCAGWALMDKELTELVSIMLAIERPQAACLMTELPDVASRCRLMKTLAHTLDAPSDWRDDITELSNVISNLLAPARNRFIHDGFGVSEDQILKIDRRVKLVRPQSFADLQLSFDREQSVDKDAVEIIAVQAIAASARLATARFDVEHLKSEGRFPESPSLERARIKQISQLRFPQAG